MLKELKKFFSHLKVAFIAKLTKGMLFFLIKTCSIEIKGLEEFCKVAADQKCLLMLWHNRLAIVPFILSYYTSHIPYTALVSASRDGNILSAIIHSYANGKTIRVTHQARYQALREMIRQIEQNKETVILTPDGPKGPRYEVKAGVALVAMQTQTQVVALNWEASRYWQLKTWDQLRLPRPFSTIKINFASPIYLPHDSSLEQAKKILRDQLP